MEDIIAKQKELMKHIPHGHKIPDSAEASVVAGLGLIEEVLEYLNAIGFKSWRPNPLSREDQLEELTDMQFFNAEMIILSGFTFDEVKAEYDRKWEVNMDRYRRAEKGDYSWDKREKGEL